MLGGLLSNSREMAEVLRVSTIVAADEKSAQSALDSIHKELHISPAQKTMDLSFFSKLSHCQRASLHENSCL